MDTYYSIAISIIILLPFISADENSQSNGILKQLHCPALSNQCIFIEEEGPSNHREFDVNDITVEFTMYDYDYIAMYDNDEEYVQDNMTHLFILCDTNDVAIDNPSFPSFGTAVSVSNLDISECNLPKNSFADVIKNLNVTIESFSLYYFNLVENLKWNANLFKGLDYLRKIRIEAYSFEIDYFDLEILQHLSPKVKLVLKELVLPPFPSWNKFETIIIEYGRPWKPSQVWGHCDNLRKLIINEYVVTELPEGWLSNCKRLEILIIKEIPTLKMLPKRMLENAESLQSLTIKNCKIKEIAYDFALQSINLKYLDMSHNSLTLNIKDNPFASFTNLETVDFTKNYLAARDLEILRPLTSLKNLILDSNRLAGRCQDHKLKQTGENYTTWPYMPSLVNLSLSSTAVIKPCPEWRKMMPNLKNINISFSSENPMFITYDEMQLIRQSGWNIDARNNSFNIIYTETDYNKALADDINKDGKNNAVILITSPLECNCRWYWFIKTLKEKPNHVSIPDLSCILHWRDRTPKNIAGINPEHITCALNDCPNNCECFKLASTGLVLINCTNALLDKIPRHDNIKELIIPDNHVSNLEIEDLPDSLDYIDLHNNLISVLPPEESKLLFSIPSRKMLLSGNPVLCTCGNKDFLELLILHKEQVLDFNNITCTFHSKNVLLNTVDIQTLCSLGILAISMIAFGSFVFFIILLGGVYYFSRKKINYLVTQHGFRFKDLNIHNDTE